MRSGLCAHAERSDGGNEEGAEDLVHDDDFLVSEAVEKDRRGKHKTNAEHFFEITLQLVSARRVAEVTETVPITQALERQRVLLPIR